MTSTFIVTLEIGDVSMIPDTALDIEDDLIAAGHDVIVVKPWARPTLGLATESPLTFGEGSEQPPPLF
jgi:hypothetical protein